MKLIHSSLLRSLIAIIAGGLMIQYRNQMATWLTICIGVLFFVSGAISLAVFFANRHSAFKAVREAAINGTEIPEVPGITSFPLIGLGSAILGLILVCMPEQFNKALIYIFAAIIVLGAINQLVNLAMMVKLRPLHWAFWILPVLILIFGGICIADPYAIVSIPWLILGILLIIYGITEAINTIQISRLRKKASLGVTPINKDDIEDAEVVEEETPSEK